MFQGLPLILHTEDIKNKLPKLLIDSERLDFSKNEIISNAGRLIDIINKEYSIDVWLNRQLIE